MKRSKSLMSWAWCILLLAAASLSAPAQSVFTYRDQTGDLSVQARSGLVTSSSQSTYRFDLRKDATASSVKHGLTIKGDRILLNVLSTGPKSGGSELKDATATGSVEIIKTVGSHRSELYGARAHYVSGPNTGNVDLNGPVRIVDIDPSQHRSFVATGSSGSAELLIVGKGARQVPTTALKHAVLNGSVVINVNQQPQNGRRGSMRVTGDHLVYETDGAGATVTMMGSVTMQGSESGSLGQLHGSRKMVLTLNQKGEVTRWEAGS